MTSHRRRYDVILAPNAHWEGISFNKDSIPLLVSNEMSANDSAARLCEVPAVGDSGAVTVGRTCPLTSTSGSSGISYSEI